LVLEGVDDLLVSRQPSSHLLVPVALLLRRRALDDHLSGMPAALAISTACSGPFSGSDRPTKIRKSSLSSRYGKAKGSNVDAVVDHAGGADGGVARFLASLMATGWIRSWRRP